MFLAGSGVSTLTGFWSNCMNTRFQYSRKRSLSPPGRSSGLPSSTPRSRYSSEHGPHGPVGPACQKFSERGHSTIRSRGTPTSSHASIASSSGPSPSSSSPANTVIQMSFSGKPKPVERQVPREPDRLALEVVAEREVAEHLEERQMPGGRPDDLDVGGAERLLAGRHARVRRPLDALEVGLERVHSGDREQRRGVELGGDQRRGRQPLVVARHEELGEGALGSRRWRSSRIRSVGGSRTAAPVPIVGPAARRSSSPRRSPNTWMHDRIRLHSSGGCRSRCRCDPVAALVRRRARRRSSDPNGFRFESSALSVHENAGQAVITVERTDAAPGGSGPLHHDRRSRLAVRRPTTTRRSRAMIDFASGPDERDVHDPDRRPRRQRPSRRRSRSRCSGRHLSGRIGARRPVQGGAHDPQRRPAVRHASRPTRSAIAAPSLHGRELSFGDVQRPRHPASPSRGTSTRASCRSARDGAAAGHLSARLRTLRPRGLIRLEQQAYHNFISRFAAGNRRLPRGAVPRDRLADHGAAASATTASRSACTSSSDAINVLTTNCPHLVDLPGRRRRRRASGAHGPRACCVAPASRRSRASS